MSYLWVLFFALAVYMLWKRENFMPNTNVNAPCPTGYSQTKTGDCKMTTDIHDPR